MEDDSLYLLIRQQLRTEILLAATVESRAIPEANLAGTQGREDGRCRLGLCLLLRGEVPLR